jgi:putative nucleotidyltransferase with HDIG domain
MNRQTLLFIIATLLGAAVFVGFVLPMERLAHLSPDDLEVVAAFIFVGILAQAAAIDFGRGRQATSSLAFIPFLTSAIVFPPEVSVVVAASVIGFSEIVFTKRGLLKGAFNVAQLVIALGLSAVVYTHILGDGARSSVHAGGFAALAVTFFSTNILLSSIGLSFYRGQRFAPTFQDVIGPRGGNLLYDLFSSPVVAATVVLYRDYGSWGVLGTILLVLVIRHFYLSRRKLEEANRDLLTALVKAIETRDPYTSGHSIRVSTLARLISEDMKLPGRVVNRIETAALLHDIGKIDPAFSVVIGKPYDLTPDERLLIQTHAAKGAEFLHALGSIEPEIISSVRHHHERFDGRGYPDGISGKDTPIAARVIMLCDSIDAMLSDRPYRKALSVATVRAELVKCSGSQFDPEIVRVVLAANTLEKAMGLVAEWRQEPSPNQNKLRAASA